MLPELVIPFFTTDTAAALRAIELNAEVVIKATKVEGIFSDDPEKVKDAKLFKKITFDEVISKKIKGDGFNSIYVMQRSRDAYCSIKFI